jgi:hypothetical protein
MRACTLLSAALVLQVAGQTPAMGAPAFSAYHIVSAKRSLSAGEQVALKLEPAPPSGTYVYWRNATSVGSSPRSEFALSAVYTAPFIILSGTPPAEVRVDLSGSDTGRIGFVETMHLMPSALPGAEDCLGPGQAFSTTAGDIAGPDYISWHHSVIVHMSDPEYPKVALARGLTDRLVTRALLCKSGRVLAAYYQTTYDTDMNPIKHEQLFVDAATAFVRGRTFEPIRQDGVAIAGWVHVGVIFEP